MSKQDSSEPHDKRGESYQALLPLPEVVNDLTAWSYLGSPDEDYCRNVVRVFHIPARRTLTLAPPKPCNLWACVDCAPSRVADALRVLAQAIAATPSVWVAELPWDAGLMQRLRKRHQRSQAKHGPFGRVVLRRSVSSDLARLDRVLVVASQRLGDDEGLWMSPRAALERAAYALRLPGVVREPDYAGTWKREREAKASSGAVLLGLGGPDRVERALRRAQDALEKAWGERPELDVPYSGDLPSDAVEEGVRRQMKGHASDIETGDEEAGHASDIGK